MTPPSAAVADALAAGAAIRALLADQLARIDDQRAAIRSLDAPKIVALAESRQHAEQALRVAKDRLRLTLIAARGADPALDALKLELKDLVQKLHQAELVNRELTLRALACVKAYLSAVAPRPVTYGRTGTSRAYETSTVSSRG